MNSSSSNPKPMASLTSGDGSGKKVRKPYTITKSRESWTEEEHDKFLEALQLFDRDWKKIEDFVGSKTVIQIRSHAQKYFLKVQKNGTVAHVPPPRPKRKAIHPYPQKAPTNADIGSKGVAKISNSGVCGIGRSSRTLPSSELQKQRKQGSALHGIPDFSEVYTFIGSVFDPDSEGHVEKLREMDPINFETVLLLMRNLTINLSGPEFEPIREVLSSYDANSKSVEVAAGSAGKVQSTDLSC
ncbi:hypothetical protein PVL29_010215 [Vitis rotundifolia]|uniref:Protein REVEILLE 8 n=1 Tax=Vitis rotundifolia TaxID=103349 RepID=A0AA38ZUL6_VITRO|nr:hypothetical protein PVL29_010215 [Vitis rotundifolia]